MKHSLAYSFIDKSGEIIFEGEGNSKIGEEEIKISTEKKGTIKIPYTDIERISKKNFEITLHLFNKDNVKLGKLGRKYGYFFKKIKEKYTETVIKNLLMEEKTLKKIKKAHFKIKKEGKTKKSGKCSIRIGETGLIFVPLEKSLFRIPYIYLENFETKNYKINLYIEKNTVEKIELSKLGKELKKFNKGLTKALNNLSNQTQEILKNIIPNTDPITLNKSANLLKGGKAAPKHKFEEIDPKIWLELEKKIKESEVGEEYKYLQKIGEPEQTNLGIKKGLHSELTGDFIWSITPIYSVNPTTPGNALAIETAEITEKGETGKATYFFKLTSRKKYRETKNINNIREKVQKKINSINKSLITINFRREPIYISNQLLKKPRYFKYRYSISKIPELQKLRKNFIGRVIHSSFNQWENDVQDLLKFNVETEKESEKWRKNVSKTGN